MEQAYIKPKNRKLLIFNSLGIITSLATLAPLFISCKNNTDKDKNDFAKQIKPNDYEQDFKLFYSELRKHLTQDYGFEWDDKNNKINIIIEPIDDKYKYNDNLIKLINTQISRALANSRFNTQKLSTNSNYNYTPPTFYSTNICLNNGLYSIKKEVGFNVVVNEMFFKLSKISFPDWIKDNKKDFKQIIKNEEDKNNLITLIKSYFFEYLKKLKSPTINIDSENKIKFFDFQAGDDKITFMYEFITNDGAINTKDVTIYI